MRKKINLGFLVIIILLWGIGIYSMFISLDINRLFVNLKEKNLPQAVALSKAKAALFGINRYTLQYAIEGNKPFLGRKLEGWLADAYMDLADLSEATYSKVIIGTHFEDTYKQLLGIGHELTAQSKNICLLKDKQIDIADQLQDFYSLATSFSDLIHNYEDLLTEEMLKVEENIGFNNNIRMIKIMLFCLLVTIVSLVVAFFVDKLYQQYVLERDQAREELQYTNIDLMGRNAELEKTFYVIEHDLKNPVFMIQGLFNQLKSHLDYIFSSMQGKVEDSYFLDELNSVYNPKINQASRYIQDSLNKMNYVLNGVHKLSRLGRFGNQVIFTMKAVSINELMLEIVDKFRVTIETQDIYLKIDDLPECIGDKDHLGEVFFCLMDNAINHLPDDRKGEIHISGYVQDNKSIYGITDNGVGIAKESQRQIFGVFHKEGKKAKGGLGLGLAIALKIIEKHKGRIWVDSDVGEGSTFFIELPHS